MHITELLEGVETLSVFEKIAQIFWGDVFTWKDLFEFIGAVSGAAVLVFGPIRWVINNLMKISAPYKAYKEDIDAVLGKVTRKRSEKYYIPTRGQDVDPCNEEEIRENNGKYTTEKLIPFLCKKAFAEDSFGKHYIILADSGMGKTTFLVNLYRYYVLKKQFWSRNRKNMRYIPLSSEHCMEEIREIENPSKTILLLDALDESKAAMQDCNAFINMLLTETEAFYRIVITCRTHFFVDEKNEPKYTGLIRAGTGDKNQKFTKKYISPFSDAEVNAYLKKRFKLKSKTQKKAKEIIEMVPSIMARPLILNWIDYLVETNKKLGCTYEIYEAIIARWIEREPEDLTKGKLLVLSQRIAKWMMDHTTTYIPGNVVEKMAAEEGINLLPIVAKSRSLLNRNSNGLYKFAHRSFLEYFLSEQVYFRGIPIEKEAYLSKMSGFGQFLVERLVGSNYSQSISIDLVLASKVTGREMLSIPIGLGTANKKSVYHYSFRYFSENQTENKLGVEIICVTEAQTKDSVKLLKSEYIAFQSDNPRTYPVLWRLRRKPVAYTVSTDFYSNLTGGNHSTGNYVYTTPLLMDSLMPYYWPSPIGHDD